MNTRLASALILFLSSALAAQSSPGEPADTSEFSKVVATLRTELRLMTGVQEGEWARTGGYSTAKSRSHDHVNLQMIWAGKYGWSAEAIDRRYPRISCVMVVGWIPREGWPRTKREGRTADAGAVGCDGDTRVKSVTWEEYVDYRVRRVLDRVARGQHTFYDREGKFSARPDSMAKGSRDSVVVVRSLWAKADSWGAIATFAGKPPLRCLLWEGAAYPKEVAAPFGRARVGAPGVTTCDSPKR